MEAQTPDSSAERTSRSETELPDDPIIRLVVERQTHIMGLLSVIVANQVEIMATLGMGGRDQLLHDIMERFDQAVHQEEVDAHNYLRHLIERQERDGDRKS